ncbi:cytochrome P450 [Mycena floridula]|nr:cytochrome P450 [Mycena floridula]
MISPNIGTAALTIFSIAIVYAALTTFHRLILSPLRGFPGPRIAAATGWYITYFDVVKTGSIVEELERLHAIYGPVVRFGPNDLHFADPEAFHDIYTRGSKFTKDYRLYRSFHQDTSSFANVDPRQAKIRREIVIGLFSRRAIQKLEPVVRGVIEKLITQLRQYHEGPPVNLTRAFKSTTLEIIGRYCFGQSNEAVTTPEFKHPTLMNFESFSPFFLIAKNLPWLDTIHTLFQKIARHFKPVRGRVDYIASLADQIDSLLANPELLESSEHENIYHHLLTPHPEKGQSSIPSRDSLIHEAMNLLAAGSETVGNTCTVGSFYILQDPIVHRKLVDELRVALPGDGHEIRLETVEKLPYLTAVIKESLRMSFGVVYPLPRIVKPADTMIGGFLVPFGTSVSSGITFVHNNSRLFPDPYTFRPERWLDLELKDLDNYLVPFSKGHRSCLGVNLAWCELYLIYAHTFRKVNLELVGTTIEDMKYRCSFTPKFRKPVTARVTNVSS